MTDATRQNPKEDAARAAEEQLLEMARAADLPGVLRRPEVAEAVRRAAAKVVDSDFDRYSGLEGVMVGRAYSIAYQELSRYEQTDGSLLAWLSSRVQAGLRQDFS
jgi:hypothetical protein